MMLALLGETSKILPWSKPRYQRIEMDRTTNAMRVDIMVVTKLYQTHSLEPYSNFRESFSLQGVTGEEIELSFYVLETATSTSDVVSHRCTVSGERSMVTMEFYPGDNAKSNCVGEEKENGAPPFAGVVGWMMMLLQVIVINGINGQ